MAMVKRRRRGADATARTHIEIAEPADIGARQAEVFAQNLLNDAIKALATRVQSLAESVSELSGDVRVMTERGGNRDVVIADMRQDVAELTNELDNRLPTRTEMGTMRTIMKGRDRITWLRGRTFYYVCGAITTGSLIWAARDWIRAALVHLRILPP